MAAPTLIWSRRLQNAGARTSLQYFKRALVAAGNSGMQRGRGPREARRLLSGGGSCMAAVWRRRRWLLPMLLLLLLRASWRGARWLPGADAPAR